MSTNTLTLAQALGGPVLTLYGHAVLGVSLDASAWLAAAHDAGPLGLASISAFRVGGQSCVHLPRPVLLPLPGPGAPLTQAECGFHPGEVLKWSVPAGTRLSALTAHTDEASALFSDLARGGGHGCSCEGGGAATLAASAVSSATLDACVSVTVNNGQVCLNVPIFGSVCIPIPLPLPSGTAAQACIDVCTKFGIPCGVKVTVSVLGQVVASKSFGCC